MFSIKIEPLIIFKVLRLRTHKLTMFCSARFLSPFFLIIVLVFGSSWRRHSESQKIIRIQKLIRTHDIPGSWTGATLEKYLSSVIHWFTFPRIALYCITNFHIVPHGFGFLFLTIFPVVSAVFCYIPIRIPQEYTRCYQPLGVVPRLFQTQNGGPGKKPRKWVGTDNLI